MKKRRFEKKGKKMENWTKKIGKLEKKPEKLKNRQN